jgi:ABC-type transport system involved in multi-copper enzyme maturation permease subunit
MISVIKLLNPAWLTGPIFDKELRVTSRRRRYYVLRSLYIMILTIMVGFAGFNIIRPGSSGSNVYQMSRMAEAGKVLVTITIWFQFVAVQIIAASVLSTAISSEITKRTLGTLMTTPITSLQIVLGKLFGNLLSPLILLAVSLPLMAILRVFGGVPWDYVVSSLCITLTALLFCGSLSLFISIKNSKSRQVVSGAFGILLVFYAVLPGIVSWIWYVLSLPMSQLQPWFYYLNPYYALTRNTENMMSAGMSSGATSYWPGHCLIMLLLTVLILGIAVGRIRKVALYQALGSPPKRNWLGRRKATLADADAVADDRSIRHVSGNPISWREAKAPLSHRKTIGYFLTLAIIGLGLIVSYSLCIYEGWIRDGLCHMAYIMSYFIAGLVCTAFYAAESIVREKEAGTLPILLTTPLEDRQIIIGKAWGILQRCRFVWALLMGHVIIFSLLGYIHPAAIVQLPLAAAGGIIYCLSTGLYFSVVMKKTSTAINMTIGVTMGLAILILMMGGGELIFYTNPVAHAGIIMNATAGIDCAHKSLGTLQYDWLRERGGFFASTAGFLGSAVFYAIFPGSVCVLMAITVLRSKVFDRAN